MLTLRQRKGHKFSKRTQIEKEKLGQFPSLQYTLMCHSTTGTFVVQTSWPVLAQAWMAQPPPSLCVLAQYVYSHQRHHTHVSNAFCYGITMATMSPGDRNVSLRYNLMGPPPYMRSVTD